MWIHRGEVPPQRNEAGWGERRDSNPRPSGPQPDALTKLSYARHEWISEGTMSQDEVSTMEHRAWFTLSPPKGSP